ncbi:MAG TPA: type II toxin-antitoxin system RelE/ParE family toxin [Methylovirgula sp.]|nr:type II toxin-antitoxin system RelE/ParE family toxin [Methylovirgula sp.]
MHTVVETAPYLAEAESLGLKASELEHIVDLVAADPQIGALVKETGGCRKFRVPGRGKGKSGGYRIVTFFTGDDLPVFLITIFGKGEQDNLSRAERNELAKLTKVLVAIYRKKGAKR